MNAQPDNDLFSGRIRLEGTSIPLEAYLLDATLEAGEPDHGPNGGVTAKSVWWTWQAPYSAPVAILFEGESTCDQGVRFYTGAALQRLTPVPEVSTGVVMVSAGQEYQIVLWSRCPSPTADVARFRLETVLGFGVDNFASLSLHSGYGGSERVEWGQTVTATREEPWEPIHGGVARGGSEWWLWQPPTNGLATVTARGVHGFRPIVAAYTGSSLSLLVPRAEPIGDDTWVWPVERDQLYWIASAAGEPGAGGIYRLAAAVSQLVLTSPAAGTVFENPVSVPVSVEGMPVGGTWKIVWKADRGLSGQVDGVPGPRSC